MDRIMGVGDYIVVRRDRPEQKVEAPPRRQPLPHQRQPLRQVRGQPCDPTGRWQRRQLSRWLRVRSARAVARR